MANEKNIKKQYEHIVTLLERKQLKDAQKALSCMLDSNPDWNVRSRLDELQTSYEYLLRYMQQGIKDPERSNVYRKLLTDTWKLLDEWYILASDNTSSQYYHEMRRIQIQQPHAQGLESLLHELETFSDRLSISKLISEEETGKVLEKHEQVLKKLFEQTWCNYTWSRQEEQAAQTLLASTNIQTEDTCLLVGAILLSLLECFDPAKIMWLMDAYKQGKTAVSQRALVCLLFVTVIYRNRIEMYPEITAKMEMLEDTPGFADSMARVYLQLLLCLETENIEKKMKEQIFPEMLKQSPDIQNLRFKMEENEGEINDNNPDWEELIKSPELEKSLYELNELQLEGADVYMASFAHLKSYPFFKEISHWFYPFTMQQPEVYKHFKNLSADKSLLSVILQSGFFSDSDKYSFFFTILRIPQVQREMMMSQLNEQQAEELAEKMNLDKRQRESIASNRFLHDLYRFFKLYPRKQDFKDIFSLQADFYHIPLLTRTLYRPEVLLAIANFYFKKEHWSKAAEVYKELETMPGFRATMEYFQKTGFCYQKEKHYAEAIEAYLKAEYITPDNIWTNRHLAMCYRLNNHYAQALAYYQRVEAADPENGNILSQIGNCLIQLKQNEEALNCFFKLNLMQPDNIKAWRGICWAAFACFKYEQAERYASKVLESKPSPADFINAGHVALAMGDIAKAVARYTQAAQSENKEFVAKTLQADQAELVRHGISESDLPLVLDMI